MVDQFRAIVINQAENNFTRKELSNKIYQNLQNYHQNYNNNSQQKNNDNRLA